jgi:hypothetical protein
MKNQKSEMEQECYYLKVDYIIYGSLLQCLVLLVSLALNRLILHRLELKD